MVHLPPVTTAPTTIFVTLFFLFTATTTAQICNPPPPQPLPCPPFTTTPPPYPFSATPNCGHPSFQIQCTRPRATISVNNLTFSLLHFEPNTTTVTLSPDPNISSLDCNFSHSLTSIPVRPIDLSNSPFRAADSVCSRLSFLKPCPPPNLPNCSTCSWLCRLVKNPLVLFHSCAQARVQVSRQGCQSDILGFLDNSLKMGIDLEWDPEQDPYFSQCKICESGNGVCGFNSSDPNQRFLCFKSPISHVRQKLPNRIAIMGLSLVCFCFLIVVAFVTFIRRKSAPLGRDPAMLYLERHGSQNLLPPIYTYEELESSTNGFDPKRKIGDGGFGSVYLGHLSGNRFVAIKYLHKNNSTTKGFSMKSFCNEILILSSINHPNLVKLYGYCSDPRGLLLVYEYVPNGTLADHLHGHKRKGSFGSLLTWQMRLDLALQIAMAIEYLHFSISPPVVHRDITSSNIFVDKDMKVKVGDFGLSRVMDPGCVWTGPQGTPGYLDPDYYRSFRLTEKSDVYSFGVVLLELITGKKAVDERREKREVALADMVVGKIQMGALEEVVDCVLLADREAMGGGVGAVAELAFRCVAVDKDDRPDAKEVVAELRRVRGRTRGVVGFVRASNSASVVVPDGGL